MAVHEYKMFIEWLLSRVKRLDYCYFEVVYLLFEALVVVTICICPGSSVMGYIVWIILRYLYFCVV